MSHGIVILSSNMSRDMDGVTRPPATADGKHDFPNGNEAMDFGVRLYKGLVWLALYAAALHFFDNVYFFDQYPEPAWLNAPLVGALWIPLALLAHRAVDLVYRGQLERSFSLVHGFVFANFVSLGHYLFGAPSAILPRINLAIALQVGASVVLLIATLRLQLTRAPSTLKWARRTWAKNLALNAVVVAVLELFWPSRFDLWWLGR